MLDAPGASEPIYRHIYKHVRDAYNETGRSRHVRFATAKTNFWITRADKCQVNRIVLDSDWEAGAAQAFEEMPEVARYVRNERLGFEIP